MRYTSQQISLQEKGQGDTGGREGNKEKRQYIDSQVGDSDLPSQPLKVEAGRVYGWQIMSSGPTRAPVSVKLSDLNDTLPRRQRGQRLEFRGGVPTEHTSALLHPLGPRRN